MKVKLKAAFLQCVSRPGAIMENRVVMHRRRTLRSSALAGLVSLAKSVAVEAIGGLRGYDQFLIQAGDALPLVVASYPRGRCAFATSLQSALCSIFRSISPQLRDEYGEVLENAPSLVVAMLRAHNRCTCLGHHHPAGTESLLARRLAADTGRRVGELDLAIEAIRRWEPLPLSGLAVSAGAHAADHQARAELEYHRFHTALLSIFLHELEHLVHPDRPEPEIRRRSNEFYHAAVRDFVAQEFGVAFGLREMV